MALMNPGSSGDLAAMLKVLSDPAAMAQRLDALNKVEASSTAAVMKLQAEQKKLAAEQAKLNKTQADIESNLAKAERKDATLTKKMAELEAAKEAFKADQAALAAQKAAVEEKYTMLENASQELARRDGARMKEIDLLTYAAKDARDEAITAEYEANKAKAAAEELIAEYKEKLAVLKSLV